MEILTALKFLLVVGILNLDVAQAEHPVMSSINQNYRDFQEMLNFFLFMEDNTDSFDETVVKAKAKCNENGGPTAYDTAVQNLRDLENPLRTLINATENSIKSIVSDVSSPQQNKDIQTACFQALGLKEWVTISRGAITPCFDLDERQSLEFAVNVSFPVIEYICENNASRILGFVETGGFECLMKKRNDIQICYLTSFFRLLAEYSKTTEATAAIPYRSNLPSFVQDLKFCTIFESLQDCIVGELNNCPRRLPSEFINSILNIIKRESGCTALLKVHAEQALQVLQI